MPAESAAAAPAGSEPGAVARPADSDDPADRADAAPSDAPVGIRDVVLVTIDTLRADALGFAGNDRVDTPALDRLAAEGWVFDNAHAHNVVTLPSHANILTGRLPFEHGVRDNRGFVLPASTPTLASLLRGAGFATGAFIGAFPLDGRFGLGAGFDVYDDDVGDSSSTGDVADERRGDAVVELGLTWWRLQAGRPRFLWLHLFDPHAPYAPPGTFASHYSREPYLGEVAATDSFLAPLFEAVRAGAEAAPALVVVTSDHGEALGDHGEETHGVFAYEATLKVPLVLWTPGLKPQRRTDPVWHIDLLPTVLEAVAVASPSGLAGRSLWRGPPPTQAGTGERSGYFEALTASLDHGWAPLRGVVAGGLKLISLPEPELYDLEADPGETQNLFDERRDEARLLARTLPAESVWPPSRGQVSAEVERSLQALGYLGGSSPAKASYGVEDDPKRLIHLDGKIHKALEDFGQRRFERAAATLQEVIRERPDMAAPYYYLAQMLLESGRSSEALAVLTSAHERGATTPALLRQLALSLSAAGRYQEAINALDPMAVTGDPDALNALGVVMSEAGDQRSAAAVLRKVFARDPRNAAAHETLALVALRTGAWSEAENHARQSVALGPRRDQAWNYLGSALYSQGDKPGALLAWQRTVEVEPRNFDALFNLGLVARELGRDDVARAALSRFLAGAPPAKYGPDLEKARNWLATVG